ncbi:anthranilate phosphoribosyltransferase [bacterium]|nr:anthranilate phosphoribosyltransferase [bacterium]
MKDIFNKLLENQTLTEDESYAVFKMIMEGKISPVQTGAFLSLLKMKGEQPSEVSGAVKLLREKAVKIKVKKRFVCDTCGTGGDHSGTFNISTCTALVAFACGLTVAKHGNRSITSKCGSADVLEAIGYPVELSPEKSKKLLETYGFAFLFAPIYHKAMKNVSSVRKELTFRTIFNIIGPLCNPAETNVQIMGVCDYNLLKIIPYVFRRFGIKGYIFYSDDGLDEISLAGKTYIVEVSRNKIEEFEIYPQEFGLKKCKIEELKGGTVKENAEILTKILKNEEKGAKRDIVILNTAFLLKASGKVKSVKEGIELCDNILKKELPYRKFSELIEEVNK